MKKKKKALFPIPLSQIPNPLKLIQNPGDELSVKVTKSGRKVAKLNTDGFKRSATYYPKTGTLVETIVH